MIGRRRSIGKILVGLRGVGKTVLLGEIQRLAEKAHYRAIFIEAHESRQKKSSAELVFQLIRRILFDLEADLAALFVEIGEAAKDRATAVAIIIDELQYVDETELSALIMAIRLLRRRFSKSF